VYVPDDLAVKVKVVADSAAPMLGIASGVPLVSAYLEAVVGETVTAIGAALEVALPKAMSAPESSETVGAVSCGLAETPEKVRL
jgi:hypothetical protein